MHSSLQAVGLTAAVSTALAEAGLSANVIAGYFHDHLFVQTESALPAMAALTALTSAEADSGIVSAPAKEEEEEEEEEGNQARNSLLRNPINKIKQDIARTGHPTSIPTTGVRYLTGYLHPSWRLETLLFSNMWRRLVRC